METKNYHFEVEEDNLEKVLQIIFQSITSTKNETNCDDILYAVISPEDFSDTEKPLS